jgi:predicted RNA-binding protein with PIN domain
VGVGPVVVVDAFNVLHAGVLVGRDRARWWASAARRRLVERVERFEEVGEREVWVVFDDRRGPGGGAEGVTSADPRVRVITAPSADDWIVARARALHGLRAMTVVTSDRALRERVRAAGGDLLSPRRFLAACR